MIRDTLINNKVLLKYILIYLIINTIYLILIIVVLWLCSSECVWLVLVLKGQKMVVTIVTIVTTSVSSHLHCQTFS